MRAPRVKHALWVRRASPSHKTRGGAGFFRVRPRRRQLRCSSIASLLRRAACSSSGNPVQSPYLRPDRFLFFFDFLFFLDFLLFFDFLDFFAALPFLAALLVLGVAVVAGIVM